MPRTPFLVATLLPVLLLAACGGDDSAATEPTKPPPSAAPPSSAAPAPPSPSPSQTAAPAPGTAADGRDLDACRDGTCEVVVKEGDTLRFNDKVGNDPLSIVSAGSTFTVTDPSGFTASIGGGGTVTTGGVRIEVGDSEGNRTAIRISPQD
ncbi:hypothetical protein E1281_37440 [Actinomadura sp. KC345]|uniref:hypothetical protein n=1 Tax=Actinomadura sp. KC345 TaxID=2530371 RepID=UPI00104CFB30|nr:hypothetical protein [Actinomadura sp. KC345]TDC41375.1 hypothetical protein E1281_37440 [Actinomadura sp. KC345]